MTNHFIKRLSHSPSSLRSVYHYITYWVISVCIVLVIWPLPVRCYEYTFELTSRLIMWLIGQAKCKRFLFNTNRQHSIIATTIVNSVMDTKFCHTISSPEQNWSSSHSSILPQTLAHRLLSQTHMAPNYPSSKSCQGWNTWCLRFSDGATDCRYHRKSKLRGRAQLSSNPDLHLKLVNVGNLYTPCSTRNL